MNGNPLSLKCRWCNGTTKECGCNEGKCAHCKDGEVTAPPFGTELRNVLTPDEVLAFANYWCDRYRDETLGEFIQRVAQYAVDNNTD